MKRYVKELARDVMRADHPLVKRGIVRHPGADKIEQVVKNCESGRMSSFEAVRTIMDIQREYDEQPWVL